MKVFLILGSIAAVVVTGFMVIFAVVADLDRKERQYWDAICERDSG